MRQPAPAKSQYTPGRSEFWKTTTPRSDALVAPFVIVFLTDDRILITIAPLSSFSWAAPGDYMSNWIGYRWLQERYGIVPAQPFRTESSIQGSRSTVRQAGFSREFYPPAARPTDTLAGHLTFALKHEHAHLEFLARIFAAISSAEIEAWVKSEPTGQYARRTGFFYEYLTGRTLAFNGTAAGNYVDALDPDAYFTAARAVNNPRWRVRDNLPGNRDYCPIVLRTQKVREAEQYDCAQRLMQLEAEFGADILQRSAVWLTIKESRASFAIEHEGDAVDRVQRFAAVMESHCGRHEDPLTEKTLGELQSAILGPRATRYGLRHSPVFVGEVAGLREVVHYIAPHWHDTPALLAGLREFAARTTTNSSLVRAAVLSFGFVYLHPMSDGNGRISRFLINDTLRRDRAIPAPFILPVSATITSSVVRRRNYDEVLELFSRPLLRKYAGSWRFGPEQVADDGLRYNLQFDAYQDALPAWSYPDLTDHVEYLAQVLKDTLEHEMRDEAVFLRSLRAAREGIKRVLEGPDQDIDRMIRSIRENRGQVSNKLRGEFPLLKDEDVAAAIVETVRTAFS